MTSILLREAGHCITDVAALGLDIPAVDVEIPRPSVAQQAKGLHFSLTAEKYPGSTLDGKRRYPCCASGYALDPYLLQHENAGRILHPRAPFCPISSICIHGTEGVRYDEGSANSQVRVFRLTFPFFGCRYQ
jgi:hypothetical protein